MHTCLCRRYFFIASFKPFTHNQPIYASGSAKHLGNYYKEQRNLLLRNLPPLERLDLFYLKLTTGHSPTVLTLHRPQPTEILGGRSWIRI